MTVEWILKVRPALLGELIKRFLRIERRSTSLKSGVKLWVDPVSHFGNEILKTGHYEPALTDLISCLLRPGDTFIDVGANEGFFSVWGSRCVGGGRVVAVEPQSRLIPVIEENLKLNALSNVSLNHLALSSKAGPITMQLTPNINTGASGFYKRWKVGGSYETIQAITLDALATTQKIVRARLMKIDCEGAEPLILAGGESFFKENRVDFISLDYHTAIVGEDAAKAMDSQLRRWGYGLTRAGNGCWVYHLPGLETALASLGRYEAVAPI